METTLESGIKRIYGNLYVEMISESMVRPGLYQATLRQEVETVYPAARPHNGVSDQLFSTEEILGEGNVDGQRYPSMRVAWIPVPAPKNPNDPQELEAIKKQVEEKLAACEFPTIFQKLSFDMEDVLSPNQKSALENGIATSESYDRLQVRDENDALVLDRVNQMPIYRQTFFSTKFKQDDDLRDYEKYPAVADANGNIRTAGPVAPDTDVSIIPQRTEAAGAL